MNLHRVLYLAAAALVLASAASAPARADTSIVLVAISGTVTGSPESVVFSGEARIQNRLAPDPDFNSPNYVLTVDLSGVSGTGSSTLKTYAISGPSIVQKKAASLHVVEITFPFAESGSSALNTRSGLASFTIGFDANTGAITAATGSVATPSF